MQSMLFKPYEFMPATRLLRAIEVIKEIRELRIGIGTPASIIMITISNRHGNNIRTVITYQIGNMTIVIVD